MKNKNLKANTKISIFGSDWLMLVILSFIPILVLLTDWNPVGNTHALLEAQKDLWLRETDQTASKFKLASSIEYWCKVSANRFKTTSQHSFYKTRNFSQSLNLAENNYLLTGIPKCTIWAAKKIQNNDSFKLDSNQSFCQKSRYMIRKLFSQLLLQKLQKPNKISNNNWEQRLKSLFGQMTTSYMFSNNRRGIPFPALFENKPRFLIWDFITDYKTKKVIGAFILLFPDTSKQPALVNNLIKKYWPSISSNQNSTPAFLSLSMNKRNKRNKSKANDKRKTPEFASLLSVLRDKYISYSLGKTGDKLGKVRLPGEMIGQCFLIQNRFVRFCTLSPNCQSIGLIISDKLSSRNSSKKSLVSSIALIIIIFWLLIFTRASLLRTSFLSLKHKFIIWFMAFALIPVSLAVGAWSSLLEDFKASKIKQIQRKLIQTVNEIENRTVQVKNRFRKTSNILCAKYKLQLINLIEQPTLQESIITKVKTSYEKDRINTDAIIFVPHGGWLFSYFSKRSSKLFRQAAKSLMGDVFSKYLQELEPELYAISKPKDKSLLPRCRVSALANLGILKVKNNLKTQAKQFGKVSDFKIGDKTYLHFYRQLNHNKIPMAIIVVLWDCSTEYIKLLKISAHEMLQTLRNDKEVSSAGIEIYKKQYDDVISLSKVGFANGLANITRTNNENTNSVIKNNSITLVLPLTQIPGFTITIRSSLSKVTKQMKAEKRLIAFSLMIVLSITLIGAWLLASWFTKPIHLMKKKLSQLKKGKMNVEFKEKRGDEIGFAASSLDKMKVWLLERKRLTSFVAPEVIDIVANGNIIKAGAGTFHEAIILVSDIRSFTTISEDYDEKDVFEMVNYHLGSMASIVEKWGGSIDRFVGDAIWAVFYLNKDRNSIIDSMNAAIEMMQKHNAIQAQRRHHNKFVYKIGIGLDKGKVLAGVIGNKHYRLDFSVIGEVVQAAEEIESYSKEANYTGIMISTNISEDAITLGFSISALKSHSSIFELKKLKQVIIDV